MTPPDPARLRELAAACRDGTDDPRRLDCLVWCELGWTVGGDDDVAWVRGLPRDPRLLCNGRDMATAITMYPNDVRGIGHGWYVPLLSTSRDAAEMLLGEPENPFVWSTTCDFGGLRRAHVFDGETVIVDFDADTMELAVLGASLEAIAARIEIGAPLPERR